MNLPNATLLLPRKFGQWWQQLVRRPASMNPQTGVHDTDTSSMPCLQSIFILSSGLYSSSEQQLMKTYATSVYQKQKLNCITIL
jgi:hypothetical protein